MSDTEPDKPVKKVKKELHPNQLAGLKKGMEIMKAKREALAKERDEHARKQEAGEIPADVPPPKLERKPIVKVEKKKEEERPVVIVPRKERGPNKATAKMSDELALLRAEISALKKPAEVKVEEKIVEKVVPVEKVVEKVKVLSGSDLLNAVFFK